MCGRSRPSDGASWPAPWIKCERHPKVEVLIDRLGNTKPLTDPLRIFAVPGAVSSAVIGLAHIVIGDSLGLLVGPCAVAGLTLLVAPGGEPNAFYLRSFRADKATVRLRLQLAAILGSDFRACGIRPPRERTSVFVRFLIPGLVALKYTAEISYAFSVSASSSAAFSRARVALDDFNIASFSEPRPGRS